MLTIQVMNIRGEPPPAPMVGVFLEPAGTIGRNDGNTLVLPDPERRISRTQARVALIGQSYVIENLGAGLPVVINDRPLAQGAQAVLAHADLLQIGPYVMRVALAGADGGDQTLMMEPADATTRQLPRPAAAGAGAGGAAASADPLALFGAASPSTAADPFADLLAPPPAPTPSSRAPTVGAPLIPDDFDPFAAPPPIAVPPLPPTAEFNLGVGPGLPGQSIDELFGLGGASAAAPAAADPFPPGHPLAPPVNRANTSGSTDPLAALAAGDRAVAPVVRVQRDDAPQINAAFRLPVGVPGAAAAGPTNEPPPAAAAVSTGADSAAATPSAPFLSWEHGTDIGEVEPLRRFEVSAPPPVPAAAATPSPLPAAPAVPAGATSAMSAEEAAAAARLLQSLFEGAGLTDLPRMPPLTPELMRVFGELLRIATEGTLQLLVARALTKREVHAEATMIAARENNPLKFSPTVEVALQHLLAPAGRGFMSPPRALKDAYDDLRSHQFGVMAGTQAALAGVLARFNPAQLEARLTQKTMLESVLPMHRKARLWDLFTELYGDISREAEEDFNTLFGKAFVKAYEAQIEKLRAEQQAQPHPHVPPR